MQIQAITLFKWNKMKKVGDRLSSIIFYSDLYGIRMILAISELIWALTLLWPGSTFGRPTYSVMAHVMDEEAWGLVFLLSGITQLSILYSADYHSRFATYFAGWNSGLWLYVVISMYLSVSPPPAAISGEVGLVIGAAWVWIRTGYICQGRRATDYGNIIERKSYQRSRIRREKLRHTDAH